jgi:hypothetical protein
MRALLNLLGFDSSSLTTLESVRFEFAWGWASVLLVFLVTVPAVLWFYRFENKPCSLNLKRILWVLRLVFLAGVISLLAGARFSVSGWVPEKNRVAVLIDASRSMSISEEGLRRIDRVEQTFSHGRFTEKLQAQTGLAPTFFTFSDAVAPVSAADISSFSIRPEGNHTDIAKAVNDVVANLGEGNLLGVFLMTDGGWNRGSNPLEALSRTKTPLYMLGAGKIGSAHDLAVSLDRPPSIGFLNAMIRARGEVRLYRVATTSVPIEVRLNGELVETIELEIPQGENVVPFGYDIPCETEGSFRWSFSVPELEDELTLENNETGFLLRVVREHLNLLLISGQPTWEQAFLRSAASSDENVTFNSWTKLLDNRWIQNKDSELQPGTSSPNLLPDLNDCDVLILLNPPLSALEPHAHVITQRVESGQMGLLIFSGRDGYAKQGYNESDLAQLFPVELTGETWRANPCNMILPSQEPPLAFLRMVDDPIENMEFFRTLPKLDGLFAYSSLKLGAQTILTSTLGTGDSRLPALVHHRFGRGNVGMFMGGPVWPMGFKLAPTDRTIRPYTAFILNLLKWLADRREDAQVSVDLPASRGFVGQPFSVRVWVMDAARNYVENAQVTAEFIFDDDVVARATLVSGSEPGRYEAAFVPPRPGFYSIRVFARHKGQALGEAAGEFIIQTATAEFDDPEIKVEFMEKLAAMTGGEYRPIELFDDLLSLVKPTPGKKLETRNHDFRDSGLILALLLLLPLAEWTIRRFRGLS